MDTAPWIPTRSAKSVIRLPGSTTSGDTYDSLGARVEEVEGIIDNDSLDSYDLNMATTNVLNALSDTTEDAYLRYYDPARYAALMQDSAEQSAGIGVLFSEYKGRAYAADVFEGSAPRWPTCAAAISWWPSTATADTSGPRTR